MPTSKDAKAVVRADAVVVQQPSIMQSVTAQMVAAAIAVKRRVDGWANVVIGLGRASTDARVSQRVTWNRMTEMDIEHLYAGDGIAAKVVNIVPDEALNKGYEWTGITPEQKKQLSERLKELFFDQSIHEAARKSRLYGGSAILKVYNDAVNLERPAPEGKRPPLKSLVVFQRFEIPAYWEDVQRDIFSTEFQCPIWYTFVGRRGVIDRTNIKIHYSRLVRFDGEWLPDDIRASNNYWGDTVFSKTYDAIRNYAFAHDSVNAAIKDLSVAKFKIKGLADNLAANCDENVIKRLDMVNVSKSIARAVVLDADGEDFEYETRTMTGAVELVEKAEDRLSAETYVPKTVLYGQSPTGGLGQSGDHQAENWYDYLEAYQTHKLKPNMLEIGKEVAEELGIPTDKLDITFNPLWQMSEKEIAETRSKQADTDIKYMDAGVLMPSEVRNSRFAGEKYSIETELDESISDEQLDAERKRMEEEARLAEEQKNNPDTKSTDKKEEA